MKNTEHKADRNLKSSANVNPSTLAMEFSLPFGSYPGRAGNSTPFTISYSSKVWHLKTHQSVTRDRYIANREGPDFDIVTAYFSTARFSRRTISGWTSSLQAPAIIKELEFYNQTGSIHSLSPEPTEALCPVQNIGDTCRYWCESGTVYNSVCGGLARYTGCAECCPDLPCTLTYMNVECLENPQPPPLPTPIGTPVPTPTPEEWQVVERLRVHLPDGSTQEFRKSDIPINCTNSPSECTDYADGTYLSANGSGQKLKIGDISIDQVRKSIIYNPDGSRYVFPDLQSSADAPFLKALYFIDRNGNRTDYASSPSKIVDTLGRELENPLPDPLALEFALPGTKEFTLPGQTLEHKIVWKHLRDPLCINGNEPECANTVLEDENAVLKYLGNDACQDVLNPNPVGPSLFSTNPAEAFVSQNEEYIFLASERICATTPWTGYGAPQQPPYNIQIFNPVVMAEVEMPDGSIYRFRYNEFGEITKIIYPTGAYDRFRYDVVNTIGGSGDQTNRGVVERWVSEDGSSVAQHWVYSQGGDTYGNAAALRMTVTGSDGAESVRILKGSHAQTAWGFTDPLAGMPLEEFAFAGTADPNDPDSGKLLRRTINEYIVMPAPFGADSRAGRDPRLRRSVSIAFEPKSSYALAMMSVNEYDDSGSTDPEHFSHLNVKRTINYHYKVLNKSEVDDEQLSWSTIEGWFAGVPIASATETDYVYNSAYKSRGIPSLAVETRTLNPTNLGWPALATTQTVYDNAIPAANGNYSHSMQTYGTGNSMDCSAYQNPKICWQNPNGSGGGIDLAYRGLPTTTRVWYAETSSWIETHNQYDQFGNVVKAEDPIGNEATTEFSATYKYAYPTKVTSPEPDPTNTHGTNQTSTVESTYDFTTGLPLTVKDDFGHITKTEYDAQLRPIRVFADNFTAPESQTIYGMPDTNGQLPPSQRFVKVRKQIDANNWDEAITWFDGLGRTIQTQAKDSQGDVYVDTYYDQFGRVERVTNPYRQGDTILWSKTRYDAAGRAVESYAPTELANLGSAQGLGITSFDISTVSGFVGTVVTTTDASGRKGRSITNSLGQLVRVDEPTAMGGTDEQDLGSLASPAQPTYYTYDLYGKMVRVQQGVQNRYFKYDTLGRLIRVSQPEQESNAGLAMSDPYNTSWQWTAGFAYDVMGNVVRATDANGVNIINEYDKAGRATKRCYTKPAISTAAVNCSQVAGGDLSTDTPSVSFYYDGKGLSAPQTPNFAKGKLTKVTSTVSETQYQLFDNLGRLTQSAQITDGQTYTSKYTYNLAGALVEEEYPSGRKVKNEFESDGDLLKVASQKNASAVFATYVSNFSYTASGGISQMRLGNGRWETAKFNNRMQVTELGLGNSATDASVWKTNYEYGELDSNGNVVTAKNTGNIARQILTVPGTSFVQSYKYDSLYRLTDAIEKTGTATNWSQQFGYDRYGNRTGINQAIGSLTLNTTPTVDTNTNRFNGSQGFAYDKNGNVVTDIDQISNLPRQFIFNGDNKQSEVKRDGVTIGRYFYDGEGKRIKKVTDTETTVFVYSSGKLIAEYSTQLSQNPSAAYTTTDHLGTPRIITNELGEVKARRDFMPFGEELYTGIGARSAGLSYGTNQDDIRQKFTGYQKDNETNLDFAEARMYQNLHGRFTAVDPLLASGNNSNPQTFNRYVYVGNNPIRRVDPSGLIWGENGNGRVRWFKDEEAMKKKGYTAAPEYYKNRAGNWVMLNKNGPNANAKHHFDRNGWSFIDGKKVPARYNAENLPSVQATTERDETGVGTLAFEYFTGTGQENRDFGPNSYMTENIRTSPMLQIHRDRFVNNNGGSYDSEIYSNATGDYPPRFGMPGAADGPVTSGLNMPRQFVGSFNVRITEMRNSEGQPTGDALFEVRNPTHFNSLAYGSVAQKAGVNVPSWSRDRGYYSGSIAGNVMSRTNQTFWWIETGVINR